MSHSHVYKLAKARRLKLKIKIDHRRISISCGDLSLRPQAFPSNDPKSVAQLLEQFTPRGVYRHKVALLLNELKTLNVNTHPQAFCIVLRCMFEVSAKAYCIEHGLNFCKENGYERPLVDILQQVLEHLEKNRSYYTHTKLLHGSYTELRRKDGILSIPSMNQVVHNLYFSVAVADICIYFNNIFPLLEAMN